MAEINSTTTNKKKRSFSTSTNRRSTRVDLTPMVDLGFLLLTFFVFTSAMSEAKTMDLLQPMDGDEKPIIASAAMTIIMTRDHKLLYYYGILEDKTARFQVKQTGFKEIRSLIMQKKQTTDSSYLMYIIKGDKNASFGDNVNLLDEMLICNIPAGHYAEVDLTKTEEALIRTIEK